MYSHGWPRFLKVIFRCPTCDTLKESDFEKVLSSHPLKISSLYKGPEFGPPKMKTPEISSDFRKFRVWFPTYNSLFCFLRVFHIVAREKSTLNVIVKTHNLAGEF